MEKVSISAKFLRALKRDLTASAILVEDLPNIPDCSSCEARKLRKPTMIRVEAIRETSDAHPAGNAWLCPAIGLFTCDEAPACTKYELSKGE